MKGKIVEGSTSSSALLFLFHLSYPHPILLCYSDLPLLPPIYTYILMYISISLISPSLWRLSYSNFLLVTIGKGLDQWPWLRYRFSMSLLSMVEAKLPPGFRFHPRDDELVCDYLQHKVSALAGGGRGHGEFPQMMMIEVDLNNCEPWDLPETACVGCVGGKEWYFFSLPDRKYATGQRTNRATLSGYWKATGKDRQVARKGVLVGMRKTLVFYQGRAPRGKKTEWVLHEFRMEGSADPTKLSYKGDWVLCRAFYKSRGTSPKPSIGETSFDDTGCSSLPPLTDTYIAFHQAPLSNNRGFEQVPCFSSFSPDPIPLPATLAAPSTLHTNFGGLSSLSSNSFNTLACDEKVIKAVLNHLTKLEGGQAQNRKDIAPHLPQGSSESYLTKTGLNSVWHPFQN